jgi:hypothetical protein
MMLLAPAALAPAQGAVAGQVEIIAELRRQIVRCWAVPGDVTKSTTAVTLTFKLGRDGALTSVPTIVANPVILEYSKQFVASASRAIKACAPYRLPEDEYDTWKDVKITFDPPEP